MRGGGCRAGGGAGRGSQRNTRSHQKAVDTGPTRSETQRRENRSFRGEQPEIANVAENDRPYSDTACGQGLIRAHVFVLVNGPVECR